MVEQECKACRKPLKASIGDFFKKEIYCSSCEYEKEQVLRTALLKWLDKKHTQMLKEILKEEDD